MVIQIGAIPMDNHRRILPNNDNYLLIKFNNGIILALCKNVLLILLLFFSEKFYLINNKKYFC